MRKTFLTAAAALLAGALTSSAAVTAQAWYHLGEPNSLTGGLPVDASGNGNNMNDGFSEYESIHSSSDSPGGPLGTSGWISSASSEWGRNGDVIIAARDGYYVSGTNFGIEAWVLPFGNGYNVFCCEGSHNYTAQIFTSGGDATGLFFGVKNNQDGTYSFVADVITDNGTLQIGDAVPLITNAWTHLAIVNDRGTNTFYVNGVASGLSSTDAPSTNTPASGGNQTGMRLGASGGDQVAFRGLIDEARAFTFTPGSFALTDLLYPSASMTTPLVVSQPTNTSVWDGGPVRFSVQAASSPGLTYQWKRGSSALLGETGASLFIPAVTRLADDGAVFSCLVSNTISKQFTLSSNAVLTVSTVQSNTLSNYRNLVTGQSSLVAYFPADYNGATLSNVKFPANAGTLEGNAGFDSRTDRAFGQKALWIDRGANAGDVMLENNADYSFPSGLGTIEALIYMSDLGVYINAGGWTFPTIFAIGDADRTSPNFSTLVGVSKQGDALEFNDGTTTLSWPIAKNLVGRFAHVAFVFDQSAGVTAYVDGKSLGTQGTFAAGSTGSPAWIGCAGSYTNSFNGPIWSGSIDELAIYTNILSANTIAAHYSMFTYGTNTAPVIVSAPSPVTILAGAANRTAVFTVSAEGTWPLGYQWKSNNVAIAGATSATLTLANADPSFSAVYSVTITNAAGSTTVGANLSVVTPTGYPGAVTTDNPIAYWRLGERAGTAALDSWGTHDGTYVQPVTYGVAGAVAKSSDTGVGFDGASSEMKVAYSPDLNPGSAFTAELWVKPLDVPQAIDPAGVIASLDFGAGRSGWLVYQSGNHWALRMGDTSGYTFNQTGPTALVAGTWYHLAVVFDGANATLYLNGNVEVTGGVSSFAPNSAAAFEVGAASGVGRYTHAQFDEVAFYDKVLSQSRIQAHYYAGQPPQITTARSGSNLVLTWPTGKLYQADEVNGTFNIVGGATSPYTNAISGNRKFYLLRAQ